MKIVDTFTNSFTLTGIYENRKKGLFKAFVHLSLLTMLVYFPLTWDWTQKDTLAYDNYGITFVSEPDAALIDNLPDCSISDQALSCDGETPDMQYKDFDIYFFDDTTLEGRYILFLENSFVVNYGTKLEFTYSGFEDLSFNELSEMDNKEDAALVIADSLFVSVKNNLLLPGLLALYVVFISMNLIYLILLSGISMAFKFRTENFPKFKEVLVMYMYAVSIPSIIAIFLTFVTKSYAFTPLVLNFATPIIVYLVYKKKVIKS